MLLSLAIWIPIVTGLVVFGLGGDRRASLQRWVALAGSVLGLLVTLPLYTGFDLQEPGFQFVIKNIWIERFNINYHLGVDGISVLFVLLNSFITVLVVIAGWSVIQNRVAQYMASFLVMSGLLNGVFSALDGLMVNGSARVVGWFSSVMRLFQSGLVYQYAFSMLIGVVVLAFWFLRK